MYTDTPSTRDEADKLALELYHCFEFLQPLGIDQLAAAFAAAGAKRDLNSLKGKTVEELRNETLFGMTR